MIPIKLYYKDNLVSELYCHAVPRVGEFIKFSNGNPQKVIKVTHILSKEGAPTIRIDLE